MLPTQPNPTQPNLRLRLLVDDLAGLVGITQLFVGSQLDDVVKDDATTQARTSARDHVDVCSMYVFEFGLQRAPVKWRYAPLA